MSGRARLGDLPVVEILVVVALAAITRSPVVIVLAAVGLVAWAIVATTGRLALVALEVDARLEPRRVVAGESTILEVRVTNRKPFPMPWLDLRIDVPDEIGAPERDRTLSGGSVGATFAPGAHERSTLRFSLRVERRGAYLVGPLRMRSGDWLGFVQMEREVPISLEVVAHPRPVGVVDRHLPSLRPLAEMTTRRGIVPDPLRFRGVREYRGGDPVKEIHWKTTARLGSLHTKLYEPATSLDTVFLVNVASYDQYWVQVDPDGAELVIAAAAELARLAAENGRQVGLITNGLDNLTHERPRSALSRGPRALTRCLDILARLGPYAGAAPQTVFLRERGRLPSGATLVAVTPNLRPDLARALVTLRRSGHRLIALTKDGPEAGVMAHLRSADVSLVVLGPAVELARAI